MCLLHSKKKKKPRKKVIIQMPFLFAAFDLLLLKSEYKFIFCYELNILI